MWAQKYLWSYKYNNKRARVYTRLRRDEVADCGESARAAGGWPPMGLLGPLLISFRMFPVRFQRRRIHYDVTIRTHGIMYTRMVVYDTNNMYDALITISIRVRIGMYVFNYYFTCIYIICDVTAAAEPNTTKWRSFNNAQVYTLRGISGPGHAHP